MIWIEAVCDGCMCAPFGEHYRKGSITRLNESIKNDGWKKIGKKIYCPECAKTLKAMKERSNA